MTVRKLYDDLYYWIHIGTGEDIVICKEHRREFQHLVKKYKLEDREKIPGLVLNDLRHQLTKPTLLQPTFYYLIILKALKTKETLCRYIVNMTNSLIRRN